MSALPATVEFECGRQHAQLQFLGSASFLLLPCNVSSPLQGLLPCSPLQPPEVRRAKLNGEIKKHLTQILLEVTDAVLGETYNFRTVCGRLPCVDLQLFALNLKSDCV